MRGTCLL